MLINFRRKRPDFNRTFYYCEWIALRSGHPMRSLDRRPESARRLSSHPAFPELPCRPALPRDDRHRARPRCRLQRHRGRRGWIPSPYPFLLVWLECENRPTVCQWIGTFGSRGLNKECAQRFDRCRYLAADSPDQFVDDTPTAVLNSANPRRRCAVRQGHDGCQAARRARAQAA